MLEKIDWDLLNTYIDNNLIIANKHPEYNIWILNYSPKVVFKKFWDIYTMSCCGLVVDANGNIIARPFKKFKSYEEYDTSEIDMSQKYEIFENYDGSFIQLFYIKSQMKWIVASRGSFISEQALEAEKFINERAGILNVLDVDVTYVFEIIYRKNKIIVDYGDMRDLILLVAIHTLTGNELNYDKLVSSYSKHFTLAKKYDIIVDDLSELKKLEEDNREGFVVKFENGLRIEVKFDEYIRLHNILSNISNITVWNYLKNNHHFDELFNQIPNELNDWLEITVKQLVIEFNVIEHEALKIFTRIYHINNITERKEFAAEAVKTKYRSILFKLYDKKSYDEIIWMMIKPEHYKPFRNNLLNEFDVI